MFCRQCGNKVLNSAKFCNKCGNHFSSDLAANQNSDKLSSVDVYLENQKNIFTNEVKAAATKEMFKGILWFIVGGVVTFITYSVADEGGTYFFFWGAMLYGIYRLIRGFYYKINPEELLKKVGETESLKDK